MNKVNKFLSRRLLLVLSIIISIFFSYIIYQFTPLKYFLVIGTVVFLISFLLYFFENDKKGTFIVRSLFLKLFHIIFMCCLIIASLSIMKGIDFIDKISGGGEQTIEINVVVLKSSQFNKLKDLKGKQFGANTSIDAININKAKTKIEDLISKINVKAFDTYNDTIKSLDDGSVSAILIKAVDLKGLDDISQGFNENIRIIDTIKLLIPSVEANSAKVTQESFSILISGADVEGPIDTVALSDVDMVATINPVSKQILLTSIPRDYFVDIIGMSGVKGKDKLTHSAKGGMSCTIKTIENLLGIKLNYYAKFNFTSFMGVIDSLGGISVDVPKYEVIGRTDGVFTTNIESVVKPGINNFDSQQALAFVRERYSFKDGDVIRGQNQMLMMKAIIKKSCSPSIITKLDSVFNSLSNSFETNMDSKDIKSLLNMQLDDMASWDVQTYHLLGDGGKRTMTLATIGDVSSVNKNGLYIMLPNAESIKQATEYIQTITEGKLLDVIEN